MLSNGFLPRSGPSRPSLSRPVLSRRQFAGLLAAAGMALRAAPGQAAPAAERTVKVAPGLYELAVSTTTNLVHVASTGARGANAAKVIGLDLRTLEVRSSIELGAETVFGLAVDDKAGLLLGGETRGGRLLVLDLKTGTVKGTIADGEGAHVRQIAVDPARSRAFVSIVGFRDKPSAIWVVDTAAMKLAGVIKDGLDGGITGLDYDAKGDRLFATALQSNEVVEVSLARMAGVRRFPSGGEGAINLAFDEASGRVFCANQKSGQLAVLDAESGKPVKVLDTGAGALGVTLSADGATAFVANRGAGTVSIVDTRALAITGAVETGTHPNTVAVDGRSGLAYVSNKGAMGERGAPPVDDPRGDTVSIIRA